MFGGIFFVIWVAICLAVLILFVKFLLLGIKFFERELGIDKKSSDSAGK